MSDDNSRRQESKANRPASRDHRGLQFSLASLFAVITAVAIILSIFFSVGLVLGMSNMDVLTLGLGRFLYQIPTLLVWVVGFTMAARRRNQNRWWAAATMTALGTLITTAFVLSLVEMVLVYSARSGRMSFEAMSWSFNGIGVLSTLVNTTCWILILMAIFRYRPPENAEDKAAIRTPGEYANPDDALSAAFDLDMKGEWAAAIEFYGEIARRWPEHKQYALECIIRVNEKRSRARQT